jgi:AcrR family transcriptional regulator
MDLEPQHQKVGSGSRIRPRERILNAAKDLFYRHGIRAVGVDAIAEAAGTNKMTLYRHFSSKDELVCECLRQVGKNADALWERLEAALPDEPEARLRAFVRTNAELIVRHNERGCFLANAVVELAAKDHPARPVVVAFKQAQRNRLADLCRAAGLDDPELVADELFLFFEGARVSVQSACPQGFEAKIVRIGEAIIACHLPRP